MMNLANNDLMIKKKLREVVDFENKNYLGYFLYKK